MQATRSDHSDISHGVANLCHENTELVEVAVVLFRSESKLADALVEFLGTLVGELEWLGKIGGENRGESEQSARECLCLCVCVCE